ncbi:MAG: prepilin-type N-terminal cleavage/methylation domain-containing protein [Pirellulales bacterium]|nr:prepilin-type N-terminal cleavage/methylation domain-containing protein [Pirellulales bacterium]
MNRFAPSRNFSPSHPPRHGYTLIEILVATTLSLLILGAVVQLFGVVGTSITQSRSIMESAERLRATQNRLQADLEGLTVTPMPPRRTEFNEGFLEIIEGMVGQGEYFPSSINDLTKNQPFPAGVPNNSQAVPRPINAETGNTDTTVGDFDDILVFTTRSTGKPFIGRYNGVAIESNLAEVIWFVRGRTLHRRVLLVAPQLNLAVVQPTPFYENNDISARMQGGVIVPNTLSDLTRRECRYAHYGLTANDPFPYDSRSWRQLGFPTLRESASSHNNVPNCAPGNWTAINSGAANTAAAITAAVQPKTEVDFWTINPDSPLPTNPLSDTALIAPGDDTSTRIADDVILTNVIGFDVKVWDIVAGQYVDLGFNPTINTTFSSLGNLNSPLVATATTARVYDTWCNTYDLARTPSGTLVPARDGFDTPTLTNTSGTGIVDSDAELAFVTPYASPLRGIQVKIRIFEPDSRQIREVTVEQDFLPK